MMTCPHFCENEAESATVGRWNGEVMWSATRGQSVSEKSIHN
jgi:hypothetical protein